MVIFVLAIVITLLANAVSEDEQRVCWYTSRTVGDFSVQQIETSSDDADDPENAIGRIHGTNQTCPKSTSYCYALWKRNETSEATNEIIIVAQGCWETSGKQDCGRNYCITSRKPPKALNDTNFCCCQGDFCNGNVTKVHISEEIQDDVSPTPVIKEADKSYVFIAVVWVVLCTLAVTCALGICIFSRRSHKEKENVSENSHTESLRLMETGTIHNSSFGAENLKLEKIIGQGRFGVVWKGSFEGQDVAIKVFPSHQKNYFYNELDIYCAPLMTHPSLLSYFGYGEHVNSEGGVEYLLYVSYIPNGSLRDYLSSHVINWSTFCKMTVSITKGIAFLHTELKKGDKFKPCITHRDLNSKNVLVKDDLTCVICDLGFATKICGSKYFYNGEEQEAEVKSISDVGTLRYMSPEVLEGAVNLRDCETSLKQIDVYALGLILWEISTRCGDFYLPGIDCPPYRLPFEAEIAHPTIEQMQNIICKHKARPLFPDLWRNTSVIRSLRETIEDCWDQDAEARLTSLCVEERFHELCELSERQRLLLYFRGISPTARSSIIQNDSQNVLVVRGNKEESCASETTVETLVAITPGNPNPKNSNHFQGIIKSVQPYQGRNPCLERNLMSARDCDSDSCELIDKSQKSCIDSSIVSDFLNVYPTHSGNQSFQMSVYNGYSNLSEPVIKSNAPIPFLQNVGVEYPPRKQFNVPKLVSQNKKITWKNFMKFFGPKHKTEDVSPQIDYNVKSNLIVNENYLNLSTPTVPGESKYDTQILLNHGKLEIKIAKDDLRKRENEANGSVLGAQNNNRPNSLPLIKSTEQIHPSPRNAKNNVRNVDKILRNIERSNASHKNSEKRHGAGISGDVEGQKTTKTAGETKELEISETFNNSVKLLNIKKSLVETNLDKICVPSANKANAKEESMLLNKQEEVLKDKSVQLKNPNLRVKTPGDLPLSVRRVRGKKNAVRLSLYDDRMMSGCYNEENNSRQENGCSNEMFNSADNIKFN